MTVCDGSHVSHSVLASVLQEPEVEKGGATAYKHPVSPERGLQTAVPASAPQADVCTLPLPVITQPVAPVTSFSETHKPQEILYFLSVDKVLSIQYVV